ncbi:MAG: WecB/TagA/CpsF family glycosyltransferase [Chloroflexota bacterium]
MNEFVTILGIRIDNITEDEAVQRIQEFIEAGTPHQVVTVNPEFLVQAKENAAFHRVLASSHLALADGVGLLWAARFLGCALRTRVTGVDLMKSLAKLAAAKGYRLFLLGAAEGTAESAAGVLKKEFPGLQVEGTYAGSPAPEEEDRIIETINLAKPHLLFVAYGAPQQDLWICRNLHRLKVPAAIGVGGAFDFVSGKARRAPLWMRRRGLEWLYRLGQEPWRWRRMLRLPRFVCMVLWNQYSPRGTR